MNARRTGTKRGLKKRIASIVGLLVIAPLVTSAVDHGNFGTSYWQARRDPTGMAPDPAVTKEAVIQVYAARAFGWRGAFAVHTWFAVKPRDANDYLRLEVIGWGVNHGRDAVRMHNGSPDNIWFDNVPYKLADIRGPEAEALIPKIVAAAKRYPYDHRYKAWPGPNSNTFTAFVARAVPELKLELPAIAIGKDYLPNGSWFARAPSGTGYQVSAFGLAGLMVGAQEGVEINLLGLVFGIDFERPALKLPGLGRLGWRDGIREP